jgi:hypothetical protein
MKLYLKISMLLYLILAGWMIISGLVYLGRRTIMPYHQKALSEPWEKLSPNLQVLLQTLVHAIGATLLLSGLALLAIILFPFRRGEMWAIYLVPSLLTLYVVMMTLIVKNLSKKTPGGPPKIGILVVFLITFSALAFWFLS